MAPAFKPFPFAFEAHDEQSQSPLFTLLPPELRETIFNLCLTDCERINKRYHRNSLWNRPGHYAPHITHTDLLRTCKRCYQEAWYMPWTNREHNIYLVAKDRRPKDALNPYYLEAQLESLHAAQGDVNIGHAHVFSQMYILEPCRPLQELLNIAHFLPRSLTITVRHTDFWWWEDDYPLFIRNRWVRDLRLPDSVVTLRMELETLERKKEQLEWLAVQAANSWTFTRKDGCVLKSDSALIAYSDWVGQSTLNNRRWIRDEARPGELDYYIATITWRLQREDCGVSEGTEQPSATALEAESLEAVGNPIQADPAFLEVYKLRAAKVPPKTPGDQARAMIDAYYEADQREAAARREVWANSRSRIDLLEGDADNEDNEDDEDDENRSDDEEDDTSEGEGEVQDSQMTDRQEPDDGSDDDEMGDDNDDEVEDEDLYSEGGEDDDNASRDSGTDAFGIDWSHQWRPPAINAQRFGGVHTQYAWDWIEHLRKEDQREHRRRQKETPVEAVGEGHRFLHYRPQMAEGS